MTLSVERVRAAALAPLTAQELRSCVVYLATALVRHDETLTFPRLTFACPWDGYLAFADLEPPANWGHACCYVCINGVTGEAQRVDGQFPPFRPHPRDQLRGDWEVIYQAPGVPDALLAVPRR